MCIRDRIRNLRASVGVIPKDKVIAHLFTDNEKLSTYFQSQTLGFSELAKVDDLQVFQKSAERPGKSVMGATAHTEIFIPLEGVIDIEEQVTRLEKDLEKTQSAWSKFDKKLSNPKFVDNAPPEVVAENKEKANAMKEKIESIQQSLNLFKS